MDGTTLSILLVALAATLPAALLHELARGAAALALTRGRVCVLLGAGATRRSFAIGRLVVGVTARPWWGGECLHGPVSARRRATVLLVGPVAMDVAAGVAIVAAVRWPDAAAAHPLAQSALWVFGLVASVRAFADLVRAAGDRSRRMPRAAGTGTAAPALSGAGSSVAAR